MAEFLSAFAQVLWPLIALAAIIFFRGAIARVLRTAEKRELEFEIGGQRLTMHELNDQQNEMIQDLQRQLSMLSSQLETQRDTPVLETTVPGSAQYPMNGHGSVEDTDLTEADFSFSPVHAPVGPEPFAVLWVTERPEQHALLAEQLRDNGVRVTIRPTTNEALAEVSENPYRLIVSDMSRTEYGRTSPDAGLTLVRELRDLGVEIPVIVFSAQRGQLRYGPQAREAGAIATTTSAYEMFKHFQNFGLL